MNKYLKFVSSVVLILFLIIYMADALGYYDLLAHKTRVLTEEKMLEFEDDVKKGNVLDNKDYLDDVYVNYRNKLSLSCSSFSNTVSGYFKDGVEAVFRIFEYMVGD